MAGKGHEDSKLFVFLQGNKVLIEIRGELMCSDLCIVG